MSNNESENWVAAKVDEMLQEGDLQNKTWIEGRFTLPMPAVVMNQQFLHIAICPLDGQADPPLLFPPANEALAPFPEGHPITWTDARPMIPEQELEASGALGKVEGPTEIETYFESLSEYENLLSELMTSEELLHPYLMGEAAQKRAHRIRELLGRLHEPALRRYYRALAPEFHNWMSFHTVGSVSDPT